VKAPGKIFRRKGPHCAGAKRLRENFRSWNGSVLDSSNRKGVRFHGRKEKSNEEENDEEDPEKEVSPFVF
jgi:hypothetical protein